MSENSENGWSNLPTREGYLNLAGSVDNLHRWLDAHVIADDSPLAADDAFL